MNDTHSTITVLIGLLLIASGVAMAAKWVPVPYMLASGCCWTGDQSDALFTRRFTSLPI